MSLVTVSEVLPSSVDTEEAASVSVTGRVLVDASGWAEGTVKRFNIQIVFAPGQVLVVLSNNVVVDIVAGQLAQPVPEEAVPSNLNVTLQSGMQLVLLGA